MVWSLPSNSQLWVIVDIWADILVKMSAGTSGQTHHAKNKISPSQMALEGYPVASFHKDKIELTKKWSYYFSPGTLTNWTEGLGERLIKFHCKCQNCNLFSVYNSFLWCSVCILLEVGLSVDLIPLSFEGSALMATGLTPHCVVHF